MVIDFHTHLFPPAFQQRREEVCRNDATFGELYANPKAALATAAQLVAAMDASGVQAAVVMGVGWTHLPTAQEANDYLLQASSEMPGRLIPFCSVNPAWGDAALREMERCAALGAQGVGELHPDTQGFDITGRAVMAPLMASAKALGLPLLTHASEPVGHLYPGKGKTTPERLWAFIQNFPENTIVCAHWGGGLPFYALMPEVEESLRNVYFDTAASPFLYRPQVFDAAVAVVGAQRVLLGTDYPLLSPRRVIAQLEASSLSVEQRTAVLGENAAALLGL